MFHKWWEKLDSNWKELLVRNWLLFKKYNGSLTEYLWDAYGAYDYFLCRSMSFPFNDIDEDSSISEMIIKNHLRAVDENTIKQILDMEFIAMDQSVSYISPLSYFNNIKAIDFHCNNSSKITDFSPLARFKRIYILDYSDYLTIDFDKFSNIRDFSNIQYIQCNGMPKKELEYILNDLNGYRI